MRMLLGAIVAAVLVSPSFADEKKLTGENTKITFVGTKPGGKHEGGFKTLTGTATVDGDALSKIDLTIEVDSIYSDNEKLTGHLKSPDFFGVKDNPKASFKSTKVDTTDKGTTITGDLTICGKTKKVEIPVKVSNSGGTLKIEGAVTIDKKDFGMVYGGGKIDDNVAIAVKVEAK